MIHELGHFLAAKHGGMKVTEYFVGFGPRLWSFRRGETEYGIKALPLGRLREDPRDDQPGGGRSGRRGPPLPGQAVPRPAAGGRGRIGHALPDGLRAPVGPAELRRRAQRQPGPDPGRAARSGAGRARPRWAGSGPGTWWCRSTGRRSAATSTSSPTAIQDHPGVPVTVVVDRDGRHQTLTVTPANGRTAHEAGDGGAQGFGTVRGHRGQPGLAHPDDRRRSPPSARPAPSSATSPGRRSSGSATSSRPTGSPSGSTR